MRVALAAILTLGTVSAAAPTAANPGLPLPPTMPVAQRAVWEQLATTADVATRVEAEPFLARAAVFEYLLDHPAFATDVARVLRLSKFTIRNTPRGMVLDDGRGLTNAAGKGHGLTSMRRRAAALGGSLEIGAAAPGTRVTLHLPASCPANRNTRVEQSPDQVHRPPDAAEQS